MSPHNKGRPLEGKTCNGSDGVRKLLDEATARDLLAEVEGWEWTNGTIAKTYPSVDFYRVMAFANAVAWIANQQDHHPSMQVEYGSCRVSCTTHDVGGLTEADFILAARIDALLNEG